MDELTGIMRELDNLDFATAGTASASSGRLLVVGQLMPGHPMGYRRIAADLLYYDGILCPSIWREDMFEVFFNTFYPDVLRTKVGDVKEAVSIQNKLTKAGLLYDGIDFADRSEHNSKYKALRERQKRISSGDETHQFMADVDRFYGEHTRTVVTNARSRGLSVTPRFDQTPFAGPPDERRDEVLGLVYSKLPTFDIFDVGIDTFIDFVTDAKTKKLRRRLFSWQNNIENRIEKGDIRIEHIPDLIATLLDDYTTWLKKSRLKLRYEKREMVYYFVASLVTMLKIPEAIRSYFQFKKRTLDLMDDEKAPGRELAYIIHVLDSDL